MAESLPSKDASTFRSMVKQYESKEYKRALKSANTILDKHPQHPETLSMKALILSQMPGPERMAEAYDFAKKGLSAGGIKSHVCWHVYGLIYRQDRRYTEAVKSYKNALRIDPQNAQIWRDLSLLQIQMRDLQGYRESRFQHLVLKPTGRVSWLSLIMADYFLEDFETALRLLDAYENTLTDSSPERTIPYEQSEFYLFRLHLLMKIGEMEKAISFAETHEAKMLDKVALFEARVDAFEKLGQWRDCVKALSVLLSRNPNNVAYIRRYASVLQRDDSHPQSLADSLQTISERFPQTAGACKAIRLQHTTDPALFRSLFSAAVDDGLRRCIPSLWGSLKPLYAACEHNTAIMGEVYREKQQQASDESMVWAAIALAKHLDHVGQFQAALDVILPFCSVEQPIADPDVLTACAKIRKHLGDLKAAFRDVDAAREMDLSDRYLCNKAVKYALRAGLVSKAEELMNLFATQSGGSSSAKNTYDMQSSWYELEQADCYFRVRNIPRAAAYYSAVEKHFQDFREDEFDFHSYSVRKLVLGAYVNLVRWEERGLWVHPFFKRAALGLIRCVLAMLENPWIEKEFAHAGAVDPSPAASDGSRKQKKGAGLPLGASSSSASLSSSTAAAAAEDASASSELRHDFTGENWVTVAVADKLSLAGKLAHLLMMHCGDDEAVHVACLPLHVRRQKWLLVLGAVKKLMAMGSASSTAAAAAAHYGRLLVDRMDNGDTNQQQQQQQQQPEVVRKVLEADLPAVRSFVASMAVAADGHSLQEIPGADAVAEHDVWKVCDAVLQTHGIRAELALRRQLLQKFPHLAALETEVV